PAKYDEPAATVNATLSAMVQYMLCVSRIAHYVKVIARDKLGSFSGPTECEEHLHRWLANYLTPHARAREALKGRYPFRAGLRPRPGAARPPGQLSLRLPPPAPLPARPDERGGAAGDHAVARPTRLRGQGSASGCCRWDF